MRSAELTDVEQVALTALEPRLGPLHVRQRLGLERDFEADGSGRGTLFYSESWYFPRLIRGSLRLVSLHGRGRRNALAIEVRRNEIPIPYLPAAFDGFTLLQLSDLLIERVRPLEYDLYVITGDYRARAFGPFEATLAGLERLRPHLKGAVYCVLGDHDTIRLVPGMEAMGYT